MKQHLAGLLAQALAGLRAAGELATDGEVRVDVEPTKSKEHGDFACSVALALAKAARAKPRELAERIVKALPASPFVEKVEIAGPGFINFFLRQNAYQQVIAQILDAGAGYGLRRSAPASACRSSSCRPIRPGRCMSATGAARRTARRSPIC